jgi:hypothetical protein
MSADQYLPFDESDLLTDEEVAQSAAFGRVVRLARRIGWLEVERLALRIEVYANATDSTPCAAVSPTPRPEE